MFVLGSDGCLGSGFKFGEEGSGCVGLVEGALDALERLLRLGGHPVEGLVVVVQRAARVDVLRLGCLM